jgi:hypothetical protein
LLCIIKALIVAGMPTNSGLVVFPAGLGQHVSVELAYSFQFDTLPLLACEHKAPRRIRRYQVEVLIIRPKHDYVTEVFYSWAGLIRKCFKGCDHTVEDCSGAAAVRTTVERALRRRPNLHTVLYYGHGSECSLKGQENWDNPAIDLANCNLLKGKVVFTIACWSAGELGPRACEAGATCYFGYDDQFLMPKVPPDRALDSFQACAERGIIEMCANATTSQVAQQRMYDKYTEEYDVWLAKDLLTAWCLFYNREALTLVGDRNARLPHLNPKCARL